MSIIYIVKQCSGEYEDYREINLKAFTDKCIAKQYIESISSPYEFMTTDFITAIQEVLDNCSEWEDKSEDEDIIEWQNKNIKHENTFIKDEMYKRGFMVTDQMIDDYFDWESGVDAEYCIEELELE